MATRRAGRPIHGRCSWRRSSRLGVSFVALGQRFGMTLEHQPL
jgi:hypothetical protein